ncbi:hypothetical protein N8H74_26535 [Pseudomonas sp. B2M1-30]|uniref:hypothetical protein n=1 Tax=Pseudomonas TaxID=286 RepID=UPI0021C852F5|nr:MULTISPECIES: hypothetical protein [Pseudomonas]MCU0121830.1 hypothetical protein [Pseudomonas sp. B2M1-30]MCU7264478.1 hypothetical protein [Pseudomonas koreensis]
MLTQPPRKISTLALLDPDIPDSPETPLPSGERSINRAAVLGVFPDKGLQVRIHPWAVMGRGDKAELLVNNNVVAQHTLQNDAEVDQRVTMFVPSRNLLTGAHTLSYRITRLNQLPETQTPPLKLYVKLELPADQDLDPGPGHSNLSMYIDPKIIDGGVDKEVAEDGVLVIIRGPAGDDALYPGAAVGDIATLSWGGVFKNSEPLTAEQISNPVDNPFGVLVDKTIIDKAGDTDEAGLAVSYLLEDVVNNRSEDWCKETRIMVSTSTDLLIAPIVKQATNNVVDLEKLGDEDPVVQVWGTEPRFKAGDIITATMRGTTAEGDPLEVVSAPETVDNLPHIYELQLKNSDIRKLAKTQGVFFYRVTRAGAPAPLRSKGQFVQIIGEGTRIDAPIAEDANQGALDPDLASTRIRIPYNAFIEAGVAIELKWFGTLPDHSNYDPELDWYFPTAAEANNPQGFTLQVEGRHVKILEGGTLSLSYIVLKEIDGEIVKRNSRTAELLNVGEPRHELVAPIVLGEKDGALEPGDLPDNRSKLTAPRPTATPSKANDVVTYTWDGEVTGKVEDSVKLNSLSANRDVNFNLEPEFVANHIEPNRGKKVTVTYEIWRAETNTTSYSEPLSFVIGQVQPELSLPRLHKSNAGVVDPTDPENRNGVVIIVEYLDHRSGDKVKIIVKGADGVGSPVSDWLEFDANGQVNFAQGKPFVAKNMGKSLTIEYLLQQDGEEHGSPVLNASILTIPDDSPLMPKPIIDDESGNELDVKALTANSQLRVAEWILQTPGQRGWVRYHGVINGKAETFEDLKGEVLEGESGLVRSVAWAWLQGLDHMSELGISVLINMSGELEEAKAVKLPKRNYLIRNQSLPVLPEENFDDKPDMTIYPTESIQLPAIRIDFTSGHGEVKIGRYSLTPEPGKLEGNVLTINKSSTGSYQLVKFTPDTDITEISFWIRNNYSSVPCEVAILRDNFLVSQLFLTPGSTQRVHHRAEKITHFIIANHEGELYIDTINFVRH